jgi:hypothetical protein
VLFQQNITRSLWPCRAKTNLAHMEHKRDYCSSLRMCHQGSHHSQLRPSAAELNQGDIRNKQSFHLLVGQFRQSKGCTWSLHQLKRSCLVDREYKQPKPHSQQKNQANKPYNSATQSSALPTPADTPRTALHLHLMSSRPNKACMQPALFQSPSIPHYTPRKQSCLVWAQQTQQGSPRTSSHCC